MSAIVVCLNKSKRNIADPIESKMFLCTRATTQQKKKKLKRHSFAFFYFHSPHPVDPICSSSPHFTKREKNEKKAEIEIEIDS